MKERKWTGHTLGIEKSIATEAFTCNPQNEKKRQDARETPGKEEHKVKQGRRVGAGMT
jgi:hypothetical protein